MRRPASAAAVSVFGKELTFLMKLLAIDSNSILNRAFYGVPPLTSHDGTHTNAIFGFLNIVLRLIDEHSPDAVAFAFDLPAPTFRHKMYDGYKAQRKGMPPELAMQFPIVRGMIADMGYKVVDCEGFEADDLLGTLAHACDLNGDSCVIATGDRDSLQLITENVRVQMANIRGTVGGDLYDTAAFREKYGVEPARLVDVKALMGDSSDNIPGVAGIGEKTALQLIARFGDLDGVYSNLDSPEIKPGVRAKLTAGRDTAYMSLKLAKISSEAPICTDIECYRKASGDPGRLYRELSRLELFKLADRMGFDGSDLPDEQPDHEESTPLVTLRHARSEDAALLNGAKQIDAVFEWNGDDPVTACFGLETADGALAMTAFADDEFFADLLAAALSGPQLRVPDSKQLWRYALDRALEPNVSFDLSLAGYLLSPNSASYEISRIAAQYSPQKRESSCSAAEAGVSDSFLSDCLAFSPLCDVLGREIEQNSQQELLSGIELPLARVLASMELTGFRLDSEGLRAYGSDFSTEIADIQRHIFELAGCEFNINSTKQLGEVLFVKLGLPARKKTKSGYSTDAEVLEALRGHHPIIDEILRFRKLSKLNSTYVEGLLKAVEPDGRIHTRFIQTETRTGRISSAEPNLQNIPVRTKEGEKLREFFIPESGMLLLDADYSQIELRILAHIADDAEMKRAFTDGVDIHTLTASQVFNMPVEFVTPLMRRRAKAVNFGIVYGISAFSLAGDIGVSVAEADAYIKGYFGLYKGVKKYMEQVVEDAKRDGYVTTLMGRRRYLPELTSGKGPTRAFGERVARNMPIQGSAADIIKLAMIRVYDRLRENKMKTRLILQVHDELILETTPDEKERASDILRTEMMNAAQLSIPLEADVHSGRNWLEAK